jgi:hypothetical protein
MALIDDVQLEFSVQHLEELTNPQDPDSANDTGVDLVKLQRACDNVEALFRKHAETTFDITNIVHREHAVAGVELVLMMRLGQLNARSEYSEWIDAFKQIRNTEARARVPLGSNSHLTITDPGANGEIVRPWAEDAVFRRVAPDAPNQQSQLPYSRDD